MTRRLTISPTLWDLLQYSNKDSFVLMKGNYVCATTEQSLIKKYDDISTYGWYKLISGPKKIKRTAYLYGGWPQAVPAQSHLYEDTSYVGAPAVSWYPLDDPPRELNISVLLNNSNYKSAIFNYSQLIELLKIMKNKNNKKLQISISDRGFILASFYDELHADTILLGCDRWTPQDIEAQLLEGLEDENVIN